MIGQMEPIVTSPNKDQPVYRLYPTQLRVVKNVDQLKPEQENKKGYFDPESANTLQVGVKGCSRIYINSPANWYRAYTFKITGLPSNEAHTPSNSSDDSLTSPKMSASPKTKSNTKANETKEMNMEQLIKMKTCDQPDELWKLVADVISTQLGRTAKHSDGETFITVTNMNSSMAKSAYYLFKHTLKTRGYEFSVVTHLLTNPLSKGVMPDVRVKQKKKKPSQQQKKKDSQTSMNNKLGSNPYNMLKTNVYC
jgi:MarR-like DNA-binding transcriptional regulator SgrR of sgrS sRNA